MKKDFFKLSMVLLFLTAGFSSCNEDVEIASKNNIGIKTHYYWSGGQKIWLDTDSTRMIVKFDKEASLNDFLSGTTFAFILRNDPPLAMVRAETSVDAMLRWLDSQETIVSKTFANLFHNSETIFWVTGYILLQPINGVSLENILEKFEIDGEITRVWADGGGVIRLRDLNKVFDIANTIYESGMVEWCHPDFFTTIANH